MSDKTLEELLMTEGELEEKIEENLVKSLKNLIRIRGSEIIVTSNFRKLGNENSISFHQTIALLLANKALYKMGNTPHEGIPARRISEIVDEEYDEVKERLEELADWKHFIERKNYNNGSYYYISDKNTLLAAGVLSDRKD